MRLMYLRWAFANASMPCQLCGRWVGTSRSGQAWRDHGKVPQAWSLWPTGGYYYQDADGHIWTVAHVQCQRVLRLFAPTHIVALDEQVRLLRKNGSAGDAAHDCLGQAGGNVASLRAEMRTIARLVREVDDHPRDIRYDA